jgi:hypothetical protein
VLRPAQPSGGEQRGEFRRAGDDPAAGDQGRLPDASRRSAPFRSRSGPTMPAANAADKPSAFRIVFGAVFIDPRRAARTHRGSTKRQRRHNDASHFAPLHDPIGGPQTGSTCSRSSPSDTRVRREWSAAASSQPRERGSGNPAGRSGAASATASDTTLTSSHPSRPYSFSAVVYLRSRRETTRYSQRCTTEAYGPKGESRLPKGSRRRR